ncbi:trypsin-like peptidase domain-containing protein [Azospirillum soli]|uniref:trypsin-like peptidase domain-containing protein n=1 Tax=Azospirillum soli TaxID=1304799 RepID=UPI001AE38A5D|nr:trypsin-like peptidase domain-containing protein [Azospirillum soli]MBP2311627.1 S1-C subfamily serine protease [Azospirillum soli]
MIPSRRFFPALAAALLLASCASLDALPEPKPSAPVARGSTEPVRFGELSLGSMRRGMTIGRYIWDIDCAPPYEDVYWTSGRNLHENSTFAERFAEVLTDAGFDVAGRLGGTMEADADRKRARYVVQGDLRDVRLELCHRKHWLTGSGKGISGTGNLRVDWSVFDADTGQLAHRVTTTGVARKEAGVPQGNVMLIEEAFSTAAAALAADPGFRAVLSRGGVVEPSGLASTVSTASTPAPVPEGGASTGPAPLSPPPRGSVIIASPAAAQDFVDDPTARASAATVRVGEGRGVVIGDADGQSVILTAVAAIDTTVNIRPAQGVTLDGAVVARDALSGLALVRVPARLTAMPVRSGGPAVSEPVTAVLKGGDEAASGIVAALRPDLRMGLDLLQADLTGPDPALGDPLVDDAGSLLGLAMAPRPLGGVSAHGLAAFVPVGEALRRMGVRLTGARLTQAAPQRAKPGPDVRLDGNRRPPT